MSNKPAPRAGFVICALVAALFAPPGAQAQRFPERPLRFITPFPPGSAPDNVARVMAPSMGTIAGQPVVVDTRPGAAGTLALGIGAKAPADGHTLTMGVLGPLALAPTLYSNLPYDPVRSFSAVTLLALMPELVLVSPSSSLRSIKDLVAASRAKPGEISYASAGSGTLPHLSAELFARRSGIKLLHVPYKGVAAALPDLMAGRTHTAFANIGTGLPYVKSGKLNALAVTSAARTSTLPDTPTLSEAAGLPGFDMNDWFCVLVPAGTPQRTVAAVHGIVLKTLQTPETRAGMANLGIEPTTSTPAELATLIGSEIARWAEVIRFSGAKAE